MAIRYQICSRPRRHENRRTNIRIVAALAVVTIVSVASFSVSLAGADESLTPVQKPPAELVSKWKLSDHYAKYVDVGGMPILGSTAVPDAAFREAAYLVRKMLGDRNDILRALADNQVRMVIMAHNEFTTSVPEHADLKPARFWDKRARGLGATPARPAVSGGAENLLDYPGDPYRGENILIHEFAHAIHQMGLSRVDPTFDRRLRAAYEDALKAERWKGTYAASNHSEYWAEGVQSWFDCNRANDHQHNHVRTREVLKTYDEPLAKLLVEVFGDRSWRYEPLAKRAPAELVHLAGFDLTKAPRFEWPADLLEWNRQYAARQKVDEKDLVELTIARDPVAAAPKSRPSDRETSVLFVNQRQQPVRVYWVDPQGAKKLYATIAAGQRHRQHTFAGHVWLITDLEDRPLGRTVADDEPGRASVE